MGQREVGDGDQALDLGRASNPKEAAGPIDHDEVVDLSRSAQTGQEVVHAASDSGLLSDDGDVTVVHSLRPTTYLPHTRLPETRLYSLPV